jgi:ferric-dicitrate binding protein FerR (iron transport regulator)
MEKRLLEKYFRNNCTEKELETVLECFRIQGNNPETKELMYNIWNEPQEDNSVRDVDFEGLLSRIHHSVNIQEATILIDRTKDEVVKHKRRQYIFSFIRNAAAILLFPVLSAGLFYMLSYYAGRPDYLNVSYNEVIASVDAITKVTLPDGSNVWLNHSSSLRYPAVFKKRSREVELKGEGYFEVAHNDNAPFDVSAGDLKISAVGTIFNIMAYPEEKRIETLLIDGVVEILKEGSGGAGKEVYTMKPNDLAIYDRESHAFLTKTISDDRYFSWKDEKLIFTAERMEDAVKKLSRWFNVDIEIKNPEINDYPLTATFVSESLPQVMDLLSMILPIRYSISDRKEIINGEYSKQKVVIYRK